MTSAFAAAKSSIVPRHLYDGTDPATNRFTNVPIGTGPFIFKEWVCGSHIIYERNPQYWDSPTPYIDHLVVKFIPDAVARKMAFESEEVDIGGESPVPLSEVDRLEQDKGLGVETAGYNYSPSVTRIEFNLDNPYLKDLVQ